MALSLPMISRPINTSVITKTVIKKISTITNPLNASVNAGQMLNSLIESRRRRMIVRIPMLARLPLQQAGDGPQFVPQIGGAVVLNVLQGRPQRFDPLAQIRHLLRHPRNPFTAIGQILGGRRHSLQPVGGRLQQRGEMPG
jgi:hypothetical protein